METTNGGKQLNEYRFTEMQRDFCIVFEKLDKIERSLSKFGERLGKAESRIDTLYWLIPVTITFTGVLVGVISAIL